MNMRTLSHIRSYVKLGKIERGSDIMKVFRILEETTLFEMS